MSEHASQGPAPRRRYRPVLILLAFLFLVEAWLWRHMEPVVQWIADLIPFERFKHWVADKARRLPPYAALALFLSPLLLVEPLEGIAVWAYAHKHWIFGSLCLLAVKLIGVGVMAFLFAACEPQLLSIGWFARLVELFLKVKAWAEAEVEPVKAWLRAWRVRVLADFQSSGGFGRRIAALRRRIFSRNRA
jgi:hypothetical protein